MIKKYQVFHIIDEWNDRIQEIGEGFKMLEIRQKEYNDLVDYIKHEHIYKKDRNSTRKMVCACGANYTPNT